MGYPIFSVNTEISKQLDISISIRLIGYLIEIESQSHILLLYSPYIILIWSVCCPNVYCGRLWDGLQDFQYMYTRCILDVYCDTVYYSIYILPI
jgi:hypothetical protein